MSVRQILSFVVFALALAALLEVRPQVVATQGTPSISAEVTPNPQKPEKPVCPASGSCVMGHLQRGSLNLQVTGPVDRAMADAFQAAFAKIPSTVREVTINLNSPGGIVVEGERIVETLRTQRARGLRITTRVDNGSMCASMCVPIFVQGEIRQAGEVAAFMFHAAHMSFVVRFASRGTTGRLVDLFSQAGVSQSFLDQMTALGVFEGPRPYWISGRELVDLQTNVVTAALSRYDEMNSFSVWKFKFWL